ncbi:MAG: FAD-dependent oxidoreductase [Pseudomonadota bacterium]
MPDSSFATLAALAPENLVALGSTAEGDPVVRAGKGPGGESLDYIIKGQGAVALSDESVDRSGADSFTIDGAMVEKIAKRRVSFEHAFIEALFDGPPPHASVEDVLQTATRWITLLPDAARREVKFGLTVLEFWLGGSFPDLSIADRQARIEDRVINASFGVIRSLGRLRTVFYSSYYQDPKSWPSIGFVPPQQRSGAPAFSNKDDLSPVILEDTEECDWVVVGSGAGGAAAAAALSAKGESVIVLEKGDYWSTEEIRHRDAEQYAQLYAGGGLMGSSNREIVILQAECIGGSSLVNNSICFRPDSNDIHPDAQDVIAHWREEYGVVIDRDRLTNAFDFLWDHLGIARIDQSIAGPNGEHLQRAWHEYLHSGHARERDALAPVALFEKNYGSGARACWGCGYCNSGCPYDRKNSVVQTLLKDAQDNGARIAANSEVYRINIGTHLRDKPVKSVQAKQNGNGVRIRPKKGAILSSGTGASSRLLERLDIANVGEKIACNLACPVVAKMPTEQKSWDGLQMATYVDRGDHLIESWFHPPASFSASVGGWFGEYVRRMQSYPNLVCLGILMPVSDMGEVDRGAFNVKLKREARERLRSHVVDVIRMHFAAGAIEVYMPTSDNVTVKPDDDIEAMVETHLKKSSDFIVSTSHPQGGNIMGRWSGNSVVGSDLRVHGTGNLYVADASIFPSSIRINAQMFTMAMAHYRFA